MNMGGIMNKVVTDPPGKSPAFSAVLAALFLTLLVCLPNLARGERKCLNATGEALLLVNGRAFTEVDEELVEISSSTVYCMSCHDGTVAESLLMKSMTTEDKSDPGKNHPVNVPYPNKSTEFVPINLLDERLALESGLVTCTTCHVVGSEDLQFPIPLAASRLCLSCHLK